MKKLLILVVLLALAAGCKKSSSSSSNDTTSGTDVTSGTDTSGGSDTTGADTTGTTNLGPRDAPVFPQGSISTSGVLTTPVTIVGQTIELTKTTCQGGKNNLFGNWRYFVGGGPDGEAIKEGKVVLPDETQCNEQYKSCKWSFHVDREYFEERISYYNGSQIVTSIVKGYYVCADASEDPGKQVVYVVTSANDAAKALGNETSGEGSQFYCTVLTATGNLSTMEFLHSCRYTWTDTLKALYFRRCTDHTCDTVQMP